MFIMADPVEALLRHIVLLKVLLQSCLKRKQHLLLLIVVWHKTNCHLCILISLCLTGENPQQLSAAADAHSHRCKLYRGDLPLFGNVWHHSCSVYGTFDVIIPEYSTRNQGDSQVQSYCLTTSCIIK